MQNFRSIIYAFFCLLSGALPAQNLLDDSRNLLNALRTVQDLSASPAQRDTAAQQALLILYLYDEPTQIEAPGYLDVRRLLERMDKNPLIQSFIQPQQDSLLRNFDALKAGHAAVWDQIQTPERTRISSLMYNGAALSPAKYLSVQQAMRQSKLPPLQNSTALRSAADRVQKTPSLNALNTEAILQGLFEFILERAQQEVAISFFENLLGKKIPKVGNLFPNVTTQYSNPNITYSQSFLEGLREAFYVDIKNLSITLPELLLKDEYFGALRQDPVFYNLLTVYTIFALSHEAPVWEVFPVVHNDLYQTYQSAGRDLNTELAVKAGSLSSFIQDAAPNASQGPGLVRNAELLTRIDSMAAYEKVVADAARFIQQLNTVYLQLDNVETALEGRVSSLKGAFPEAPASPDRTRYLANPLYDYEVLIGNAAADTDTSAGFDLNLLPQLLRGQFDTAVLSGYNSFQSYDKFFATPRSSQNLRVSGLELVRNLGGNWYNDLGILDILQRWQSDLSAYESAVGEWQASFDTTIVQSQEIQQTDLRRASLLQVIVDTRTHWSQKADEVELQPLVILESIAGDFELEDFAAISSLDTLSRRREKLFQLEQRLVQLEQRLSEAHPQPDTESPLTKYLTQTPEIRLSDTIAELVSVLEEQLQQLNTDLDLLDQTFAPRFKKAWINTRPMLQLTEFTAHLFYALQSPNGLMSLATLDSVLYEPELKQISMGLLQQRMSRIKDVGVVSPDAIAQFTRLTLEDLLRLQSPKDSVQTDSMRKARLFNTVSTSLQSFNRILQFPLFADPAKPQAFTPLVERNKSLAPLPDISERCMNFLYYLETGENRTAVSSLLRLMTTLSQQIDRGKSNEERAFLLRFFEENGDFIAGLVDAQTKNQVEYLLKSLADPPGSSRTKRTHSITVGINAYVGASAGREYWERKPQQQNLQSDFNVLAPTMPIGFTVSKRFGTDQARPQSFSLFVSLLDLGAMMTAHQASEEDFGSYKLTYKNMFKPGVQVHWNIQRTPFYLGLGWQTGAQFRILDDKEITLRSSRTFLAFGIDVPVKTLYQR